MIELNVEHNLHEKSGTRAVTATATATRARWTDGYFAGSSGVQFGVLCAHG